MPIQINELTLYRAVRVDASGFNPYPYAHKGGRQRQRYLLAFTKPVSLADLRADWTRLTLIDGRVVEVRRTGCGGSCRCAGEFRPVR